MIGALEECTRSIDAFRHEDRTLTTELQQCCISDSMLARTGALSVLLSCCCSIFIWREWMLVCSVIQYMRVRSST